MKKFTSIFATATIAFCAVATSNSPQLILDRELQAEVLKAFRSSPAAIDGKIYYQAPEQLKDEFSLIPEESTDPVQDFLNGKSPLTSEIMEALKGKVVSSVPIISRPSYQPKYEGEMSEMVTPSATIYGTNKIDSKYDILDGVMVTITFQRVEEEGNENTFIFASSIGVEESAMMPVPEGTYDVIAITNICSEEDNELDGFVVFYKRVELTMEDSHVELFFDEADHTVQINALDPQGKPFPAFKDNQNNYATTFAAISIRGCSQSYIAVGSNSFIFLVPDLENITHSIAQTVLYHSEIGMPYCCQEIITEPILSDVEKTVDYSRYREYSASFSLTPTEMEAPWSGVRCIVGEYGQGAWGSSGSQILNKDEAQETISFIGLLAPSVDDGDSYLVTGYELSAISVFTEDSNGSPTIKTGGFISEVSGEPLVYPIQTMIFENKFSHEYYPSLMIVEQPDKFFTKALFCNPKLTFSLDWNDGVTLRNIYANYDFYGPYNERFYGMNPFDYMTSIKLDGKDKILSDIMNNSIVLGGLYEFTFDYNDLLVNDNITTSNVTTYGYVANKEWIQVPEMRLFQIRSESDEIVNEVISNENAILYIGAKGDNTYGCDVELYISPQESDEWISMEASVCDSHPSVPVLNGYNLSQANLENEGWYKAKVRVSNSYGCFLEQIINNSFYVKTSSSLSIIKGDNNEAIFYNLQGQRVTNPKNGLYIKVVDGKSSKVIF